MRHKFKINTYFSYQECYWRIYYIYEYKPNIIAYNVMTSTKAAAHIFHQDLEKIINAA